MNGDDSYPVEQGCSIQAQGGFDEQTVVENCNDGYSYPPPNCEDPFLDIGELCDS